MNASFLSVCGSQRDKAKSLRTGPEMPHRRQKSRARNNSLPDSRSHLMGVFSDDFAAVDVREELCYHSRPEKAKFKRCTEERKQNQKRKLCAAAKAAAGPQADQRGRLRAAALSRRRKLRFSAACQSNPPALLRYVLGGTKEKCRPRARILH